MAKCPVFYAKRQSKQSRSHSGHPSHSDNALLAFAQKARPRCLGGTTGSLRSPGVLQNRGGSTEKRMNPRRVSPACFPDKTQFLGTFGRSSQSYLKGRFVRSRDYIEETCCSYASTAVHYAADSRFSGIVNYSLSTAYCLLATVLPSA